MDLALATKLYRTPYSVVGPIDLEHLVRDGAARPRVVEIQGHFDFCGNSLCLQQHAVLDAGILVMMVEATGLFGI